jgi:hypothetical protein
MSDEHTERTPAALRGYRVLSDEEKALVDRIKLMEAEVGKLWAEVHWSCSRTMNATVYAQSARDLFRLAFMELVRTVTKPLDVYGEALNVLAHGAEPELESDHG